MLDNGADPPDNVQVVLLGEGECLLDNVKWPVLPMEPIG